MGRTNSYSRRKHTFLVVLLALGVLAGFTRYAEAITASIGQPYSGRLINGIPFPRQFPGYQLREEDRTYTTPEVIGALLDAIEAVRTQFPGTCDVYLGDFSSSRGGSAIHHRSHQNGRDVDVGMYVKGNRRMDTFLTMTEDNLDVAKTWCLIENLIRSQRVQYIFLDRRVQKPLYEYAASRGADPRYLDLLFGNLKGSIIQHLRNHQDHMHVRFFTPWSTLAGHVSESEERKRMVIEMAQQAYLPKKVQYYVNGSEKGLDALASSFGVTSKDLCRWNQIPQNSVLVPGSCLIFYKRGFEFESVNLARSLQPGFIAEAAPVQVASLQPVETVSDAVEPPARPLPAPVVRKSEPVKTGPTYTSYRVKRGDTVDQIARRTGMDVQTLRQMNNLKKNSSLKPGQSIRIALVKSAQAPEPVYEKASGKNTAPLQTCDPKEYRKSVSTPAVAHTVAKGDTLDRIAKRYGTDVATLIRLNGLKKNAALKPGQAITVKEASKVRASAASEPPSKASAKSCSVQVASVSKSSPVKNQAAGCKLPATQPAKAQAAQKKAQPAPAVKATPAAQGKVQDKKVSAQAPARSGPSAAHVAQNPKATAKKKVN